MRRLLPPILLAAVCILVAVPQAFAQVDAPTPIDEVDPGAQANAPGDEPPAEEEAAPRDPLLDLPVPTRTKPAATPAAPRATTPPTRMEPSAQPVQPAVAKQPASPAPEAETAPPPVTPPPPLPPVVVPAVSNAQLETTFAQWRKASAELNRAAADQQQKTLLGAREEIAAADLEAFSMATARSAEQRLRANDPVGAIEQGRTAVQLAPDLPWSHFALARIYFGSDASDVGRWGGELKAAVTSFLRDPRFARPAAADLAFALLTALLATAVAVCALVFLRRARYFLHDFHHLFPRAAARWQTVPLALLLLSLPVVFRLGLLPVLLVALAAVTLYLGWKERLVAAGLIALVGLVPLFAQLVTSATVFSGTVAEQLYQLDRGGIEAEGAAEAVRARMGKGQASWADLFALGRYELRRGRLAEAGELFKKAALEDGRDARLQVNLGNVRFGLGDPDGAGTLYAQAIEANPQLAAAYYDLAQVHLRRAAQLTDADRVQETNKAQAALENVEQLDPALAARPPPPKDQPVPFNRLLVSPGLSWDEIRSFAVLPDAGERVADQLEWRLLGRTSSPLAWLLPGLLAFALAGAGALRDAFSASKSCDKCGRPVCRRCDPELGAGSFLCGQCVNVFARRGVVAPQVKVRKMIEADRYRTRTERLSFILGIVCSGAGHLYRGLPLRGAVFSFAFLFLVFVGVFHDGVLRAPYGEWPVTFRLLPAGVALALVYLLSLRSLRKAQLR